MKARCMIRSVTIAEVSNQLKVIETNKMVEGDKLSLDKVGISLIQTLINSEKIETKKTKQSIITLTKKLSDIVESGVTGYVFQLIDCMNLLGVSSFYLEKYTDAYESFLLVL